MGLVDAECLLDDAEQLHRPDPRLAEDGLASRARRAERAGPGGGAEGRVEG